MSNEFYWSIVLEPSWVQASIWTIEDKKARVVAISPSAHWEDEEELVHKVDAALSAIIESLPEDAKEPSKTVFGVIPDWVEGGQIKKEHLAKLRDISSKLSLKPSGFVVLPEAIAHQTKLEEGSPLTGIILGIESGNLEITLFKLGNLVGTVRVGRSVSVVDDVVEGLTRFDSKEHFPSRVLIYDGKEKEIEDVKQELTKADWTDKGGGKVKFLHSPKIESITPDKKVLAVSLAGASEIGTVESVFLDGEEKETKIKEPNVKGSELSAEDVGFALGEDVSKKDTEPVAHPIEHSTHQPSKRTLPKPRLPKVSLPGLPSLNIGIPSFLTGGGKAKKIIFAGLILLALGVGGIAGLWWFIPKAEVIVFVSPKRLEELVVVTFDENVGTADFEELVFPAELASVIVSGEKTGAATGAKTVGDAATGSVLIRNGTSQIINLKAGDELFGPNELVFVVDQSASISGAVSPSEPGTAVVEAAASDIGAEYNIASDEVFTVSNFPKSEVDAIANSDFSGGTSRDIVAVSQKDLDDLEETLIEELSGEGALEVEAEAGGDKFLLKDALLVDTTDADFTHKVGDEATNFSVALELEISALVVPKKDIMRLSEEILKDQIPEGFNLKEEQLDFEFTLEDAGVGEWIFEVNIIANLLPKVNPDDLAKSVAGKHPRSAQEFLNQVAGYSGAEITVKPPLPSIFGNIPRNLKNITIEIVAER